MNTIEEIGVRKLAAIMFTDIKGFSKKMGENETVAMALLKAHDAMMKELFGKYDGRVIKSIGDSFMVDFSSAVNAVKCAIEVQEIFWHYNKGKGDLESIAIRIGIHLGDVITDGHDIFGDGVNIASRIEAITSPSRICISQDIYNQIKNKMEVHTYSLGMMEFKNIAEPIEIHEILIDSIPELAEPSRPREEVPSAKHVEASKKLEELEAGHIDALKRKTAIREQKVEKEKEQKIKRHYEKAAELFSQGKLDDAETELGEIFKVVALHAHAQLLQLQIDEERFKRQEQERLEALKAERQKAEEKARKVEELLRSATKLLEEDKYVDALTTVKEIYPIDPYNEDAKELEERVREAKRLRHELIQAEAEAARVRGEETVVVQKTPEVRVQSIKRWESRRRRKRYLRRYGIVAAMGFVAAVLVIFIYSEIRNVVIPRTTSLVILPFEVHSAVPDTIHAGNILSALIASELARYEPITIIAPTSASYIFRKHESSTLLGQAYNVNYVVLGDLELRSQALSLRLRLIRAKDSVQIFADSFEARSLSQLSLRENAVRFILNALQVEVNFQNVAALSQNLDAITSFFQGVWALESRQQNMLDRGIGLLRTSLRADTTFSLAYSTLAQGLIKKFKLTGEKDRHLLRESQDLSMRALRYDQADAVAYQNLGTIHRYRQKWTEASNAFGKALEIQPNNAECYRQLAFLAMIGGDDQKALGYAATALRLDPENPDSYETIGIINHVLGQYPEASKAYAQAISLGGIDSLITTRYRLSVWSSEGLGRNAVRYAERIIAEHPDDVRAYYWVGRAYQLTGLARESLKFLEEGLIIAKRRLEAGGDEASTRAQLALIASRLGQFKEAEQELEKALALEPNSAELMYRKANLLLIQNKKIEALDALKQAVNIEFSLPEVLSADFIFLMKEPEFRQTIIPQSFREK